MSDELLPYYERELAFIRRLGGEFAEAHPKIAGRLVWSAKLDSVRFPLAMVVRDGQFIVAGTDGTLMALDAQSGRQLWRASAGAPPPRPSLKPPIIELAPTPAALMPGSPGRIKPAIPFATARASTSCLRTT